MPPMRTLWLQVRCSEAGRALLRSHGRHQHSVAPRRTLWLQVRRSEAGDAQGKAPQQAELQRMLLSLVEDRHRPRVGLRPLPASSPPPPPPSKCVPPLGWLTGYLQT